MWPPQDGTRGARSVLARCHHLVLRAEASVGFPLGLLERSGALALNGLQ